MLRIGDFDICFDNTYNFCIIAIGLDLIYKSQKLHTNNYDTNKITINSTWVNNYEIIDIYESTQ